MEQEVDRAFSAELKAMQRRLARLEEAMSDLHTIAADVRVQAEQLRNTREDLQDLMGEIRKLRERPRGFLDGIQSALISSVVAVVVAYLFNMAG